MPDSNAYMFRCLELAKKGKGKVEPNPMVGALLVYKGKIIGEGYHEGYGKPHAEVNAISAAVSNGHEKMISGSTLYVTLEPCSHHGKTPPCSDLIIEKKIPEVVIGCMDPNPRVNGLGIKKLTEAGIRVSLVENSVIKKLAYTLIRPFINPVLFHRPYVILKWTETADGFMGSGTEKRLMISNDYSNRLVHKWRSEETAILIGKNTALMDDPALTNRLWPGKNPMRMVIDLELELPTTLKLFDGSAYVTVFNYHKMERIGMAGAYCQLEREKPVLKQILSFMQQLKLSSLLVEGGAQLLQSFINENLWDEIRLIKSRQSAGHGLRSPLLNNALLVEEMNCLDDQIYFYRNA